MRWATYKRLRAVDAALQEQWLLGAAGDLGWPLQEHRDGDSQAQDRLIYQAGGKGREEQGQNTC